MKRKKKVIVQEKRNSKNRPSIKNYIYCNTFPQRLQTLVARCQNTEVIYVGKREIQMFSWICLYVYHKLMISFCN